MALRQRPGETVNRYHLRMQGILRRFPDASTDVPDAFLKSAFIHGLRAEFQDWVACWKKAAPASEVDGGGEANGAAADK
uniref:Retrotransposon gag domain-containing protein n=1 Tax=Aegilops tauschii TaxID=37682 RepID=M8BUY3_AEGTA